MDKNEIAQCKGVMWSDALPKWDDDDNRAAQAEGWLLAATDGWRFEIQRCDWNFENRDPWFDGDEEARSHVFVQAMAGSDLHQRAYLLDGERVGVDTLQPPRTAYTEGL